MRGLWLTSSFLILATAAAADTFALQSSVSAVTVYPDGATVMRRITLPELPAGNHTLLVTDVPQGMRAESLRIFGGEGLVITSTGFRDSRLPPDDREIAARKAIEEKIAAKRDEIQAKYDEKASAELVADAAKARIAFLQAMSGKQAANAAKAMDSGAVSVESLRAMLGLVGDETLKALQDAHAARQEMKAIDKEIEGLQQELQDLQQELDAVSLPPADRVIVRLDVSAAAATGGEIGISYQVDAAGWMPVYDLHLDTDSAKITMDRKAMIGQGTGEPWNDVAVTLSTARPQMRLSPGELWAQQARLYDPAVTLKTMSREAVSAAPPAPVMAEEAVAADMAMASVDMQGLSATYILPAPVTLDGDYTQGMFAIDQQILPVEMTARAIPLLEENVYLVASLKNDSGTPFLPGKAGFYRDGTFIGSGGFEMVASGEGRDLAFGAIDGLTTKRITLRRESGESGVLTTRNDKVEEYKLRVENATSRAWNVVLLDRAPYSEEEDLKITTIARPKPDEVNVDGKRGVLAWHFPLAAGADKTVEFTIKFAWPRDKELEY